MTPARWAWLGLVSGVVLYDAACPPGHTLSEEVDRWLLSHPALTWIVGTVTFAHLLNIIPQRCDPIHLLFTSIGRRHPVNQALTP